MEEEQKGKTSVQIHRVRTEYMHSLQGQKGKEVHLSSILFPDTATELMSDLAAHNGGHDPDIPP